ncbi:MAG: hypothetical protein JNL67_22735 [Planctomycetaceae bacterium]|nr:hypothetical protein [Planctomycetaceae bacterium]
MSTSITRLPSVAEVPRPITDKLSHVMQRQKSHANLFRWSGWLVLTTLALLSMVGCDLYFEFDSFLPRLGGWLLAIIGVAGFGRIWQRFSEQPLNWLEAAWRVESMNPQLDERLSSTIELLGEQNQHPQQSKGRYSTQLLSALSQEATRASATINPEDIPVRSNTLIVSTAVALVTLFLCVTVINPRGVGCSLRNWLLPWADPIFPQLTIELSPGEVTLVQGEPLTVQAPTLAEDIDATLERITRDTTSTTPFDNANVRSATLLDLQEDSTYRLRIGKRVSRTYPIRVLAKPEILSHSVQVQFPDYTGMVAETSTNNTEPVLALTGSTVTIQLEVDQHARLAELKWDDQREQSLTANNFRFEIPCREVGTRTASLRVLSAENIPSESIMITIEVFADLPPTIQILDPTIPRFYLPRERELVLHFAVQDDFDIQQVELMYETVGVEPPQQHSILTRLERLPNEEAAAYQGQALVTFDKLPEDCRAAKVWLRARDNRSESFGGPQLIESDRLMVEFKPIDSTPLEQRLASEQQEIQKALEEARQDLEQAQNLAERLSDETTAEEVQNLWDAAREKLADSQKSLERLAEKIEQSNSDMSEQAQAARAMADEPLEDAQRQLERGQRMDKAGDRAAAQNAAGQAQVPIQKTLDQLEQLEKSLAEKSQQLESAAKLEDLARQQEKLANDLATPQKGHDEAEPSEGDRQTAESDGANSEPESTDADWQKRQQQVADELATLQNKEPSEADSENVKNENLPEQQSLMDQAEEADRLARNARDLADRLEQAKADERRPEVAREKQKEQIQEVEKLQKEVEQMAQQERERPQDQQPAGLKEAQQLLEQAKQKLEEEAQNAEQNPQDPNQNGQQGQQRQQQQQPQDANGEQQGPQQAQNAEQNPQDPNQNGQHGQQRQQQQQPQDANGEQQGQQQAQNAEQNPQDPNQNGQQGQQRQQQQQAQDANGKQQGQQQAQNAEQNPQDPNQNGQQGQQQQQAQDANGEQQGQQQAQNAEQNPQDPNQNGQQGQQQQQPQDANGKQQGQQQAQNAEQNPQDPNQNGQQGQQRQQQQQAQDANGEQQGQQQAQNTEKNPQDPNQQRENGQPAQAQQPQKPTTPADALRQAADALQKNCESCRECANCKNPGGNGGKSSGQPKSQRLAEAKKDCDAAAQAPQKRQAEEHAKQAAEKLSELAQQAAQQAGLRKNCDKCKKPGEGQSEQAGQPGNSPIGTKSVTDEPMERLPLRGETSSGWTRAKRQLRNGLLDGREALIPESFRDVVTEYFEALAQDAKESE